MMQVTPNIVVEGNLPCNMGIIKTSEGIVVIDTPMNPAVAMKWKCEIENKGKLRYVIYSEEHGDHCFNGWFFNGLLIASEVTRAKLVTTPKSQIMQLVQRNYPDGLPYMESYQVRIPDITFVDGLNVYLGDHTFNLFPLPGHSPGGIAVYIPQEKVVFATDIVFHHFKSFLHTSNPEQWLNSLKRLSELDVDTIVPGHGEPCKKEYLKEQANIVQGWIDTIKSAIKQGLSVEEAKVKIVSPDPYSKQPEAPGTDDLINYNIIDRLYLLYSK